MSIKESELPVAVSIGSGDYLRLVTSAGDSKLVLANVITQMDHIVTEQGTDGIWTYRKWSDGVSECWGVLTFTSLAMTSAEGSGYYAPLKTFSHPSGLFIANPVSLFSVHLSGAIGGFNPTYNDNTEVRGYFWATRSVTKTVYLYVHSMGRWK